jgi:hypothetical protein
LAEIRAGRRREIPGCALTDARGLTRAFDATAPAVAVARSFRRSHFCVM